MFKIVENYKSKLDLLETQVAIKFVKDEFEKQLAKDLNLVRVSAPLFLGKSTNLNDGLNGIEKPVSFEVKFSDDKFEIVQSLAKWKRKAIKIYGIAPHQGIYTDMNAIRKDEEVVDNIHSIYVDQWDYEIHIEKDERNIKVLKKIVKTIFRTLKKVEAKINKKYPCFTAKLPENIYFISSRQLEKMYPNTDRKEREYLITKEKKAVFVSEIGWNLRDGKPHDGRAADYDDWKLNGDILVYDEVLDIALELSSMGIRVDENSIVKQLKSKGETEKLENSPYVNDILNKNLPYTLGGGIGQSRICMFFLEKCHIGEVQSSIWPDEDLAIAKENNIKLL